MTDTARSDGLSGMCRFVSGAIESSAVQTSQVHGANAVGPRGNGLIKQINIVVPVRNGGARWREAARALQAFVPDPLSVVVIDSSSSDGSDVVAKDCGFKTMRIDPSTFNHGATRQWAVDRFCFEAEFVIFLTQDAVIDGPASIPNLIAAFEEPAVGASYGRQLPHPGAGPFEAHMALFNYGSSSRTQSFSDAASLGIKAAYLSNSFAAYRLAALQECGGFPSHLILGEDTCLAVKMLLAGWKIRYCADAQVRHSHAYTVRQEAQRYFDFGVMHEQLPELMRHFGAAEGEGARFVASELRYFFANAPWRLPLVPVRNAARYVGYRMGRMFRRMPLRVCRRLSMTKAFWCRSAA